MSLVSELYYGFNALSTKFKVHSRARRHQTAELHGEPSVSETSQIFMKVQLMLILFLALSALYTEFG